MLRSNSGFVSMSQVLLYFFWRNQQPIPAAPNVWKNIQLCNCASRRCPCILAGLEVYHVREVRLPINDPFHPITTSTTISVAMATTTTTTTSSTTTYEGSPAWQWLISGSVLCGCEWRNANSGSAAGRQSWTPLSDDPPCTPWGSTLGVNILNEDVYIS